MPIIKVGRPATRLKTTYRLIDQDCRGGWRYALVERTRTGQLTDLCFIIVVSFGPIPLDGRIRLLAALPQAGGGFRLRASEPEAWFSQARFGEAQAAFTAAVRRKLKPKPRRARRDRPRVL